MEDYFVNEMSSHGIPEMQRSNLVSTVIQVFHIYMYIMENYYYFFNQKKKMGENLFCIVVIMTAEGIGD